MRKVTNKEAVDLLAEAIGSSRPNAKPSIDRNEWDLLQCPKAEMYACLIFEYTRSSDNLRQRLKTHIEELEFTREQLASRKPRPSTRAIESVIRKIERHWPAGHFLHHTGFDRLLAKPWMDIPATTRTQMLLAYFGTRGVEAVWAEKAVRELPYRVWVNLKQKNTPRVMPHRGLVIDPHVAFPCLTVDWDYTDAQLEKGFTRWLQANRPQGRDIVHGQGFRSPSDLLKALSAHRLLDKSSSAAQADAYAESVDSKVKFGTTDGWIKAKKLAEQTLQHFARTGWIDPHLPEPYSLSMFRR